MTSQVFFEMNLLNWGVVSKLVCKPRTSMRPVVSQAPLASYDMLTCTISFCRNFGRNIIRCDRAPPGGSVLGGTVAIGLSDSRSHTRGKKVATVPSYHLPGIPWVVVEAATTGVDPCTVKIPVCTRRHVAHGPTLMVAGKLPTHMPMSQIIQFTKVILLDQNERLIRTRMLQS